MLKLALHAAETLLTVRRKHEPIRGTFRDRAEWLLSKPKSATQCV